VRIGAWSSYHAPMKFVKGEMRCMKSPPFHKFVDRGTKVRKALLLTDKDLMIYIEYMDSRFTDMVTVYDSEEVTIKKYVCPHMRLTAVMWHTYVLIVAFLKKDVKYRNLAVFGPVTLLTTKKIDDYHLRKLLFDAIAENWNITLTK
jgi:hypothetical protein